MSRERTGMAREGPPQRHCAFHRVTHRHLVDCLFHSLLTSSSMLGNHFLLILAWVVLDLLYGSVLAQFVPVRSAARIRLSDGLFIQLSRVVDFLYGRRVMHLTIPNEQQCFDEGCVQIYALQVTAQRPPTLVVVAPSPPNLLTLTIADFDIYITGSVSGSLQLIPPIPITVPASGSLSVAATHMEVGAVLDIQKSHEDRPFLRVVSCYIRKGAVTAKVDNMGLLTNIVNMKYHEQMKEKAEEVLQRTVCGNVQEIVEVEFNGRIAKVPTAMSVKDLIQLFQKTASKHRRHRDVGGVTKRFSEALGEHDKALHKDAEGTTPARAHAASIVTSRRPIGLPVHPQLSSSRLATTSMGATFNMDKLSSLIISLSVLDTSATYDKFFIGVNGDVMLLNHTPVQNPYERPTSLKFMTPANGKPLELLLSEYTVNTLLLKAHSIGALVFRIGSKTPVFGKLLRTSCSVDEVCLSDSVPEPGERYPNKQLEMIIRTTRPPRARFTRDTATVYMEGRALFYLEGTTEKVGVIPFAATVVFRVRTENGRLYGTFSIPSMELKNTVDFFDLPVDSLSGFRDATKGALENVANRRLKEGIAMEVDDDALIAHPSVLLMNGVVLIQTDFNVEKEFYSLAIARNPNFIAHRS